ncbi:hypothetical protein K9F62_10385 [Desulfovibrio sp. JY]|nr:hypothetical protein K9F62_10385 [Desulfovibrio sp. JY]
MTPEQFEQHMAVQNAILREMKAVRRLLTAPVYTVDTALMTNHTLEKALCTRKQVASEEFE